MTIVYAYSSPATLARKASGRRQEGARKAFRDHELTLREREMETLTHSKKRGVSFELRDY